jgi:ABC-type branched-subunit amino acid transport system ATPase component
MGGNPLMSSLLELSGVDAFYGSAQALHQIAFAIKGGTCAVVGRNGMGKTTLCRAIMGLTRTTGTIVFAGEPIGGLPPHAIAARGIGYVPQGRRVFPSLTVDEHLRMIAGPRSRRWTADSVYDVFPRLAERRHNRGNQLSGGEQQMLAIGRALTTEPKLLLMDEPTEGLAPIIVDRVISTLQTLAASGLSILIVEQDIAVASALGRERSLVMMNGWVVADMPAGELLADPTLRQRWLGLAA